MRKHQYKVSALVMASALFLTLVGCTSKITNMTIGEGTGTGKAISHGVHSYEAEEFSKLNIEADVMNVVIEQGKSSKASIELITDEKLEDKMNYEVSLKKEVLHVKATHKKSVKQISGERTLKVTLPDNDELILSLDSNYGDLKVIGASLNQLDININVGDIEMDELVGNEINIHADTGDIDIYEVTSEKLTIDSSLGDIELSDVKSGELVVALSTGDLELTNVEAKLDLNMNLGDVDIVGSPVHLPISVKNDVGNISLQFATKLKDAELALETNVGKISSSNKLISEQINNKQKVDATIGAGDIAIELSTNVGSIKIR